MRILALYDVHSNSDALAAVLADPRAAGPDAIVVGGDVVPGAFAGAAIDRLRALSADVHWVRGNGERETAAAVCGPRPAEGDNAAEMSVFTARQLGPERARALGELALSVVVDGVLFCHATPRSDEELVTRIVLAPAPHARFTRSGRHRCTGIRACQAQGREGQSPRSPGRRGSRLTCTG
jgi:hypothetical protein